MYYIKVESWGIELLAGKNKFSQKFEREAQ